jgi:hypothetical protein
MIQDYPDEWIDDAIVRAASSTFDVIPRARLIKCREKMIAIRETARKEVVRIAPGIRPSEDEDIQTALYLRAGDILGTNRKSGWMPKA